ncbi:MAG: NTP transferase domain-containing protein [Actinobacteria bacterium]|nr:NTP transferase domain-containing protein [Actinomycetota bacterium]MCI0544387.1 NTP transferase domain-containing protein [Actinomycetota bacterium]
MVGVIPVRSFREGMSRLAPRLTAQRRAEIGEKVADRVLETTRSAGLHPLVVTRDEEVELWATARGVDHVGDPGTGLDDAATSGVEWALSRESSWLVLHADLPLVAIADLEQLLATIGLGRPVIAPSADGGTTAISSVGRFRFGFGPGSFRRHLGRLDDPVIVVRNGLLHDLDTTVDLEAALIKVSYLG